MRDFDRARPTGRAAARELFEQVRLRYFRISPKVRRFGYLIVLILAVGLAAALGWPLRETFVVTLILLAFVAAGFEHSVANMTALTLGLLVPNPSIDVAGMVRNLAIVSLGNIIGGLVFVVGGYLAAAKTDVVPAKANTRR